MAALVVAFSDTRSPHKAASLLSVALHPALVVARRLKFKTGQGFCILNRILYRADAKFADHAASRPFNERATARRARNGIWQLSSKRGEAEPLRFEGVQQARLLDHFREVADPAKITLLR